MLILNEQFEKIDMAKPNVPTGFGNPVGAVLVEFRFVRVFTVRLINSLSVLSNKDFSWKKPPKSPLSGGLAVYLLISLCM